MRRSTVNSPKTERANIGALANPLWQWLRQHRWPLGLSGVLALLVFVFLRPLLFPPPGQAAGGTDIRALFVPWFEGARQAIRQGRLPLWDPQLFGGYPFLSNPQVAFFYPPTWLSWLLPVRIAISWLLAFHLLATGVGMMLFMRAEGASRYGALMAAVTLTFSGFASARINAGHLGVLSTLAWLPWLLVAFKWSMDRGSLWAATAGGLPLAFSILAGHTTSLLYVGLIWSAYALYRAQKGSLRLAAGHLLVAGLAGAALSAVQLLPLLQLAALSSRAAMATFDSAADFSLPAAHLITLFVPEYFGEPLRLGYWSVPVFEEYVYYAGVLPLLTLPLLLRRRGRHTWFFVALMTGGLWLALGRQSILYRLLYDWVPPFRLARAPARAAFLFTFGASAALGVVLTAWRKRPDDEALGATLRWTTIGGAVAASAALAATGAVFALRQPGEGSGRLWHQAGGWAWLLLLLLVGTGALWLYLGGDSGSRARRAAAGALFLLLLADLWGFGYKFVRLEPTAPDTMWRVAREAIGSSELRVLPWGVPIFEQNGAAQAGLNSIFGYNALSLAANERLTSSVPDPRSTAYDLFSVGYVVAPVPLDSFVEGEGGLRLLESRSNTWVYARPGVLPLVRFVSAVETISDGNAAIARIHESDFSPESTVILDQAPPCQPDANPALPAATAHLLDHDDTTWRIVTDSPAESILVVSESAYPGWTVTIDDLPAEPLTAYTALRAVCVPPGKHIVQWTFRPVILGIGAGISVLALILMAFAAGRALKVNRSPDG